MAATMEPRKSFEKRARTACDLCKVAKVRCNALEGSPCGNCVWKGVECVVNERDRRRTRSRICPTVSNTLPKRPRAEPSPECSIQLSEAASRYLDTSEDSGIFESVCYPNKGVLLSDWNENPAYRHANIPKTLLLADSPREHFWSIFTNLSTPERSLTEEVGSAAFLPGFIKPLPATFSPTTAEYLQIHGVLTLPSLPLQNVILRAFTDSVLPCIPIIEWHSFIDIINSRDGSKGHISLLLYHAVMSSGATFTELGHLLKAGYSNRREALETYVQKTKLLYESNYETDSITVIQALLLMTYQSVIAGENETKHWLDVAISMAQKIGLFQTRSGAENSLDCPRMWKRLGWTCYMTDCIISLRFRGRPSIRKQDFCHQMLTVDDFESQNLPAEDQCLFTGGTLIQSTKAQRDLALICISHAQLCVCISDVLEIQGKAATKTPINRRSDSAYVARVATSDRALTDWMDSLPPSCQYKLLDSGGNNDGNLTLFVHRSIIHMTYYTVIAVLHRSQISLSSNTRVHHAAHQITQIASELHKRRLHNCLSVTGATAILVAMIIHISEIRELRSPDREEAMEDFQSCMAMMASLQDVYPEANAVTEWMLREMANVALDGGLKYGSWDYENLLSGDLTVRPCSLHLDVLHQLASSI